MRRSNSTRRIGLVPWLIAMVITAALLVVLFSWLEPVRSASVGRFGIGTMELDLYSKWFDIADTGSATAIPDTFKLTGNTCITNETGPGWDAQFFVASDYSDSVKVRRLRSTDGGWVVKFERERPFHAQRHIVLMPADVASIRAKYLEILAHELGLVTPEISFVRVIACGRDLGIHLKEERIDADFLEKQGLAGASLFEQGHDPARPDHLFPAFEDDTLAGPVLRNSLRMAYADLAEGAAPLSYIVDRKAGIGRLLMLWLEHGPAAFEGEQVFAYDWSKGRVVPLYRHTRSTLVDGANGAPVMMDPLSGMMLESDVRDDFNKRREQLLEERWRLKERFEAMDHAWLPILANGGSLSRARSIARGIQDSLLNDRLDDPHAWNALQRKLVRYAGAEAFDDGAGEVRYWPTRDDPRILDRIAARTKARVEGDTLVFPRGRYSIEEDLTIPYGHPVVIEQGARFEIAAGKSVVIQGPLDVRGTTRNPVFVRPKDDNAPFGTFAVVGDGTTRCSITGLQLSGGSEARVNGVYFSGQFAIHNGARTVLKDCIIAESYGEDLLNIKGGSVLLERCVFEDGFADLVDLDRCTGRLNGCVFRSGRRDSNGDGLDVSGSRILVTNCAFIRMMDKGISVGEASQLLVRGSRFEGNRLALAAKDLSIAYVEGNIFTGNRIIFGAYRKKPIYGGARVMRYANEYSGNEKEQELDSLSAVVPKEVLGADVIGIFAKD
ncbi:MAG: right-handed parallel beta-helix repeat-containing protein [Flavobacteriales bacterium]|nr:right-handed parallel beta-helix repeat-containing protein [Flavobacteriales bacterium]MCC6939959.1 right-handed parallel beta-helix repeat-containing protein [Flavobacteriales bacterium]